MMPHGPPRNRNFVPYAPQDRLFLDACAISAIVFPTLASCLPYPQTKSKTHIEP
jgi:hypothetical protein